MSHNDADRIRETTTTTGTGSFALSGNPSGKQPFSVVGDGNTCYYVAEAGSQWEVGLGTYASSGNTLARTTVYASSNGGAKIDFASAPNVWNDIPAKIFNYLGNLRSLAASELVRMNSSATALESAGVTLTGPWIGPHLDLDTAFEAGVGHTAKTLVVGKLTPIKLGANLDGNLAANVTITLPSASAGDTCGFLIWSQTDQAGSFAQAPGYCAEIANATLIEGVSYTAQSTGSGKYGGWLRGDLLILRYVDSTHGWQMVIDGLAPHLVGIGLSSSETVAASGWTALANFDALRRDVGSLQDSGNNAVQLKRAGDYTGSIQGSVINCADAMTFQLVVANAGITAFLALAAMQKASLDSATSVGTYVGNYTPITTGYKCYVYKGDANSDSINSVEFTLREIR